MCFRWTIRPTPRDVYKRQLLTQRHPDKLYGLVWEMNGGPVLAGEINRKGACRELREEAGLRCAKLCEKRFYQ